MYNKEQDSEDGHDQPREGQEGEVRTQHQGTITFIE